MAEVKQSSPIAARARQWLRRIWPDAAGRARRDIAQRIYCDVVNQGRMRAFYRDFGVPDTPEGRFEMVGLHVALVLRRLRDAGEPGRALGQELFDLMFADMDESLRLIGIGDLGVGKQIKRLAGSFYARLSGLDQAFATEPSERLRAVLRTNVYHGGTAPTEAQLDGLVRYVIAAEEALRAQSTASLLADRPRFGTPAKPGGEGHDQRKSNAH